MQWYDIGNDDMDLRIINVNRSTSSIRVQIYYVAYHRANLSKRCFNKQCQQDGLTSCTYTGSPNALEGSSNDQPYHGLYNWNINGCLPSATMSHPLTCATPQSNDPRANVERLKRMMFLRPKISDSFTSTGST